MFILRQEFVAGHLASLAKDFDYSAPGTGLLWFLKWLGLNLNERQTYNGLLPFVIHGGLEFESK